MRRTPTETPPGLDALPPLSGGSGEAPQAPATFGNRFAIGERCSHARWFNAEGVPGSSRGWRRFADTPGPRDQGAEPRRGLRRMNPTHGCGAGALAIAADVRRKPLRGWTRCRHRPGGSGETPQPPATVGNRFAVGERRPPRITHGSWRSRAAPRPWCTSWP
jgi:hypothetical protein